MMILVTYKTKQKANPLVNPELPGEEIHGVPDLVQGQVCEREHLGDILKVISFSPPHNFSHIM